MVIDISTFVDDLLRSAVCNSHDDCEDCPLSIDSCDCYRLLIKETLEEAERRCYRLLIKEKLEEAERRWKWN